jgi:hypothetical protein
LFVLALAPWAMKQQIRMFHFMSNDLGPNGIADIVAAAGILANNFFGNVNSALPIH